MSLSENAHRVTARHPIAVVAARTGLSPDVLRVWERRYGVVRPKRGPGGQRLYSDADIERLRLLHEATGAGRGIGQIAHLPPGTLRELVAGDVAARQPAPTIATSPRSETADAFVAGALALARRFDAVALREELRRGVARDGLREFVETQAVPLLRAVGDEWHAGRLSPAQEHLVSSEVHDMLAMVMRDFPHANGAPALLVATPAGERHVIGAALVGAAAAVEGWNVIYLGADLPAADLARAARDAAVSAVALSVIYAERAEPMLDELRALCDALPSDVRLVVGGAGVRRLAPRLARLGIHVETDVDRFVASLAGAGARP